MGLGSFKKSWKKKAGKAGKNLHPAGYRWRRRAGSDAGSGSVAAAAAAPVVAGAAPGYRRRRWRRLEQGEGKKVGEGERMSSVSRHEQPEPT